jgi:SsrA-binding protein
MKRKNDIVIKNKKAEFDYEFLERFTAGIVLVGTEIKSIREGKASLVDSYCYFTSSGELYIRGLHIAEYWWGNLNNHAPKRERKLLLTRKELDKLHKKIKEKGLTVIASKLFIAENGYAKLLIGLARGKKVYDKRESIKDKDIKRDLQRVQRDYK